MSITADDIQQYAKRMLERETRGNGDHLNAIDRVSTLCRMSPRSFRRLVNGETKDPSVTVCRNVVEAYERHLSQQIAEMQHELAAVQSKVSAMSPADLEAGIESLAAKLEQAKRGVKG